MAWLGTTLAYAFLAAFVAVEILGILGAFGAKGRKTRLKNWPRVNRFLAWNAAINHALATLVVIGLLVAALVQSARYGLAWIIGFSAVGPLVSRSFVLLFFLYIFIGVAQVLGDTASEEAMPLLKRGFAPLVKLVRKKRRASKQQSLAGI